MPPKRLDSLGRVTEPLAEHLWEKSWDKTSPQSLVDWEPKQTIIHASGGSKYSALFQSLRSQSLRVLLSENVTLTVYSWRNSIMGFWRGKADFVQRGHRQPMP